MSVSGAANRSFLSAGRWLPPAIILAASLILSSPLFRGGLPYAHDTEEHLERYICFADQLSHGELYPRWLANANGGLGSPVMFVYAPLAYYVPAALRPLLHFRMDGSKESREVAVSMWLALAASGLAALLWLKSFVNRVAVAVFGALLYMVLPYHFVIDLYTRAAVSEMWAFAWMPLILYFGVMVARSRTFFAMAGFIVSYALLVFTHLLTTLIFTPVAIGVALLFLESGRRRAALTRLALSLALAIGLSAAYLAPALQHEKDVSPDRLAQFRPTLSYPRNFVALRRDWTDPTARGDYVWKVSWITICTAAAAAAAFALKRLSPGKETAPDRFWGLVAVGGTVMMFPISKVVWDAIPQLAALQFPYRFNMLLSMATTALIASAIDSLTRPLRWWRIALAAGIAGVIALWAVTDLKTVMQLRPGKLRSEPLMAATPLVLDVLLPGWSKANDPRFLKPAGILELSQHATVSGAALKKASLDRPGAREIELTEDGAQGWVTLPLLFYPAWMAQSENGSKLNMRAVPDSGLAEVAVPAGVHRLQLTLPLGPTEKLGIVSTAVSALLTVMLLAGGWWDRRRKNRSEDRRIAAIA